MNEKIANQLQARIEAFAADVTEILTRAVADGVQSALASSRGGRGRGPGKRGPGRPRATSSIDPDRVLKEVAREGGRRVEEIAVSLGVPSKALQSPMRALLADKKVKKTGVARGTKYSAR